METKTVKSVKQGDVHFLGWERDVASGLLHYCASQKQWEGGKGKQ